jgi:hypothetical protein
MSWATRGRPIYSFATNRRIYPNECLRQPEQETRLNLLTTAKKDIPRRNRQPLRREASPRSMVSPARAPSFAAALPFCRSQFAAGDRSLIALPGPGWGVREKATAARPTRATVAPVSRFGASAIDGKGTCDEECRRCDDRGRWDVFEMLGILRSKCWDRERRLGEVGLQCWCNTGKENISN